MKKHLTLLLTLLALITPMGSALADAPPFDNDNVSAQDLPPPFDHNGYLGVQNLTTKTVWVTIYNDTLDSIRDVGCVSPNDSIAFGGYMGFFNYRIRVEVKDGPNCSGKTLFDKSRYHYMKDGSYRPNIYEDQNNTFIF